MLFGVLNYGIHCAVLKGIRLIVDLINPNCCLVLHKMRGTIGTIDIELIPNKAICTNIVRVRQ